MPDLLLDVQGLETTFKTPDGVVHAVNGVSFTLKEGETLGVVGESGCGKSVTMHSMLRLIPTPPGKIVAGKALFFGQDLLQMTTEEIRHVRGGQIGMIFQDPMTSLNPVRTIGAHLADPLRRQLGLDRQTTEQKSIELLDRVGIPEPKRRLRQYPHELSGGMRQRVMIAIALSCDPAILIADEPTTALDVTVQKQILDLLAELAAERRMATILISHDLGAIAGRSNQVAVMYAGRIVEMSPTAALFAHPHHPYTEALIASSPELDKPPHTTLRAIDGQPPDMANPPVGCRFAPRCSLAVDHCRAESPDLIEVAGAPSRTVACHLPIGLPARIQVATSGRDN